MPDALSPTDPHFARIPSTGRISTAAPARAALPAAPRPSWGDSLRLAAIAFFSTRAAVWLTGVLAAKYAGLRADAGGFDPQHLTGGLIAAPGARWDTTWFIDIANNGYADVTHTAFFPLYPFLARAVGAPFGSALFGGFVVSFAAGVLALALLHRLAVLELGAGAAAASVWLLATFPAAFFLSAVYSESLFLALSLGAVYAARTDRWTTAAALGALATATRSAGIVLLAALLVLWWQRSRRPQDLARLAAVPLGLALFCLGLKLGGLPASAPFDAQRVWFREFAGPFVGVWDGTVAAWDGARQLLHGSRTPVYFARAGGDPYVVAAHNLELFATLLATIPMLVGALRRLPPAYGLYAVAALALPLSYPVGPQPLMSLPRFVLVLFPLFMWLGLWASRNRGRIAILAAVFMAIQLLATAEFATWHWVA